MQEHNAWAQRIASRRNAGLQAELRPQRPTPGEGRAALDALHQKGQAKAAAQGKTPEPAKAVEASSVRGRVGLDAALYKSMNTETKPTGPAPGKGRGGR